MIIVVNYLNSVFHIEVKTKSNDKFLNFIFQFIENTKWHFGYMDFHSLETRHKQQKEPDYLKKVSNISGMPVKN